MPSAASELCEKSRSHTGTMRGQAEPTSLLQQQQVCHHQQKLLNNSDDRYWGGKMQVAAAAAAAMPAGKPEPCGTGWRRHQTAPEELPRTVRCTGSSGSSSQGAYRLVGNIFQGRKSPMQPTQLPRGTVHRLYSTPGLLWAYGWRPEEGGARRCSAPDRGRPVAARTERRWRRRPSAGSCRRSCR